MSAKKQPPAEAEANPFRRLPAVNELVDSPQLARWRDELPRALVVAAAREELAGCRQALARVNGHDAFTPAAIVARIAERLEAARRPPLGEVINATGILIHTGLGRAPLSPAALAAIESAAGGYTALELDLKTGERGKRVDVVREQLCQLTGAESATVVNNNAAGLVITLATLAAGRAVIVSRGELIEIGGSFRLPEVMAASGANLFEVGTTNKTRAADFAAAIGEQTAVLLKVHPSNYRVIGFTSEASVAELATLGKQHDLPLVHDIGSGALFEPAALGLGDEPVARRSIEAGADLVLFSGDKLLGGPQAGLIVGRGDLVSRIERHPLMRALRVDKLTLAALSATLTALAHPDQAIAELPVWSLIAAPMAQLRHRAASIAWELETRVQGIRVEVVSTTGYLGGGSLPADGIESVAVAIDCPWRADHELARRLRAASPAVMGRVQSGRLLVDLRAVFARQDESLTGALVAALASQDD